MKKEDLITHEQVSELQSYYFNKLSNQESISNAEFLIFVGLNNLLETKFKLKTFSDLSEGNQLAFKDTILMLKQREASEKEVLLELAKRLES